MSFSVRFEEKAIKEFTESVFWYDEQSEGLGEKLMTEIDVCISFIQKNPFQFMIKREPYREYVLQLFPFILVYVIDEKESDILIVSVFHTSRNPTKKYKKR